MHAEGAEVAIVNVAHVMNRMTFPDMGVAGIVNAQQELNTLERRVSSFFNIMNRRMTEGGAEFAQFANDIVEGIMIFAQSGATLDQVMQAWLNGISLLSNWEPTANNAKSATTSYIEEVENLIQSLREEIAMLEGGELAAVKLTDAWKNADPEKKKDIQRLIERKEALEAERDALRRSRNEVNKYVEALEEEMKVQKELATRKIEGARTVEEEVQNLRDRLRILNETSDVEREYTELLINQRNEREELLDTLVDAPAASREMALALLDEAQYRERVLLLQEQQADAEDKLRKKAEQYDLSTKEARLDLLVNSLEEIGRAGGEVFDALIGKTNDLGKALVDMIQNVARTIFEHSISSLLFSALGNIAGNAVGGSTFTVGRGPGSGATPATGPGIGASTLTQGTSVNPAGELMNMNARMVQAPASAQENVTIVHNHYNDIRALDGPSVRDILVRERDTVSGITMSTISRSRNLKRSGLN